MSIWLSRVSSATALLSRPFSVFSCFRHRAWSNSETTVLGPPAVEDLLRDTDAPDGLNNSTSRGDDHLRLSKLVDDIFGRVLPIGHV